MKIIVDNREHTLIKLLKALSNDYNFTDTIEISKLDIGDIAIHSDEGEELLILERKNRTRSCLSKAKKTFWKPSRKKRESSYFPPITDWNAGGSLRRWKYSVGG